ncbi:helix-turn-helix domain-containing protein [Faecalibacterium duncaniae]|jgi:transcriptional regulator with XRE-family HTH domain|nr:helix-turn-helix domain-containing protein [Faecalibacterium prausnitzii]DAX00141.1 MAG TPA: helix-turn-helix domain protein [Caudoviricetes sp.]
MNERLKQLRKALKLNQVDFGAKLSLTGSAISRYESGVNAMADNIVLLICREFDVNEEWLRYGTGSMFSQKNMDLIEQLSDKYDLGLYGRQLLETYLELSDSDKRAVERFVANLTANVEKAEKLEENRIDSNISIRKKAMNQ